ncbi:MAG TPA: YbjQ family protein [Candidatus Ozemobacteraceae bacterium]|nr:YbjQ family protein [Candidatus Ozemobacteraceae bacterium]HOT27220.1 YbjQ family protein [Candidatus Ozemobacteraceae bacterium]
MLITTTDNIDGHVIEQYLGLVTGEAVFGVGTLANIAAGFKDLVGRRVESFEKELESVKNVALVEMIKEGKTLAAHAIVGVDVDYHEFMGKYVMVVCNGTAVRLKGFKEKELPDNFMMPITDDSPHPDLPNPEE